MYYASHFFSMGFPRKYLSEQLERAEGEIHVIRRHHAKRLSGRGFVPAPDVPVGRCPAHHLASVGEKAEKSHQVSHHPG